MKTIEINLYSFDELSKDAQEKAIEKLYDLNVDYEWWESVYDDAENIGLKITGFDSAYYCTGEFITSAGEVVEKILSDHGKDCETYKTALRYKDSFQHTSDEVDEDMLDNTEDEFLNDILEDYRIMLRDEYEYQTSKDAIIESIKANEYTFEEDGTLHN